MSVATLAIQKLNYSNPLVFRERKDEIGDLAKSFETMRSHIEKLIFTDTLTGVFNRRYLLLAMAKQLSETLHEEEPFVFIMIDLDHFKAVNDVHGHGAGDTVLTAVASILAKSVKDLGMVARYGGEEFCVLLPGTDEVAALLVAERLREAVQALEINCDGKILNVTCSLGIAEIGCVPNYKDLNEDDVIHTLMSYADLALYSAKRHGRNCSMTYSANASDVEVIKAA